MNSKLIVPILIAAFIAWRIYIRTRRSFGRQRVQRQRMLARITVFALLAVLLLLLTRGNTWTLVALLAGGAGGAALGYLGLRHTRFESTPEGRFYTPHSYLGLALTAAFLARIVFDYFTLSSGALTAPAGQGPVVLPAESPLTLAVSAAFSAYYITYYAGILRKSRQRATPDAIAATRQAPAREDDRPAPP